MIESFRQQCLSLVLAYGNQAQAGRNDSCKPIVSKCERCRMLLNAAFKVDECIGGGSIAVGQRKSIPAGFFASANHRVESKQTFPHACAGGAYSAGRPDGRQLLIYVAERLAIPRFESKHAFHESQTFTRYENRLQEMLHPLAKRDSVANMSCRNGCFEPIGIRKRAHWKKRIRELQSADEVKRFH